MKLRFNKTVAAVTSSAVLLMAAPTVGVVSASAGSVPTYTIGYQGPLSGSYAYLGQYMYYGALVAINNANAGTKFGKLPFKLKLARFDDQGSSTIAPSQAQAAIQTRSLVAIVGPAFSGATEASEPYYSKAHMPTVSPSATAAALAKGARNNFMRVVAGDDVQGAADANFLVKTHHVKSLVVINNGSFYGAGLAAVVSKQAKKDGAKVTNYTDPTTGSCGGTASTTQYAATATQIMAAHVDGVYFGGYYCGFGLLLGALSSAGYTGTIMSDDGSWSTGLFSDTTPPTAANGVYVSEAGGGNANLTGKLASQFQKLSHQKAQGATYAAQAYDATNMIIKAMLSIKRSPNIKVLRGQLVVELHKMTFKGVTGTIHFQGNGDLSRNSIVEFAQANATTKTFKVVGHS